MNSDYGIQLRHPAPNDIVGSQLTMAGLGTAFEATYVWKLQADGRTIAEGAFQAGSMAIMGGFAHTVNLDMDYTGPATLQLGGDTGADDGLPVDLNEVPVIMVGGTSGYIPYQVRPGDTLTSIAETYDSTVSDVALASRLADPDKIKVGQILRVPA